MADLKGEGLKLGFDGSLRLEFHGAKVTLTCPQERVHSLS